MDEFIINGIKWEVQIVNPTDPILRDRTGKITVAVTDPNTHVVYISSALQGEFLMTVFIHELGHCVMVSCNLLDEIHRMVYPDYWIEAEEFICNFLADYGRKVFSIAFETLGYDAWRYVPRVLEQLVA